VGIWVIVCVQKTSHFLQTFHPLRTFKIVFCDSSLYPKQMSLYCLPRVYARGSWGYVTKTLLPAKRRLFPHTFCLLICRLHAKIVVVNART